ncbi:hypothetical protein HPB49_016949 [Dermacentor silvarum]|uniref:Uncharacterized protein n=1 Tax=Dermacentor silvarum TaxID=543639 RepID=A0ACB8C4I0_DERSI|nr:hypothetical protein HPB49_016949 [Dermacentor silvarum]
MCKSTQTLPVAKKVHRGTETTNMDVQDSGPCAQDISAPDVCALPPTLNTGRNHELNPLRNSRADGVIQHAQRSVHVTIVSVKAAQTEATLLSKSSVDAAFGTSGIDCKDVSKPTQASHATEKVHVWTGTTDLRNFQDNNSGARASPEKKRKKMDVLTFYRATRVKKHAKRRKILDDKSAEAMLLKIGNGDISDVDFSDDDFDDSDVEEVDKNISSATMAETVVRPAISNTTDDASTPSTKLSVKWVDGQLSPSDTACSYQPQIGSPPREPLVYFSQYFSVEIFENLATFTNLYALQGNGELVTTKEELQVFFGILMLMGILKFPRVRMYWQTSTRIPAIADAMTAKRFFKIRLALHITDSNAPQDSSSTDKFWKVRPMLEAVRQRCLQLEPLEHSSIDEQHVAVTGHVSRKRSAKGKPHPRGFKMFVRCSADGLAHDLELYQGKCAGASAQRTDFGHEGSVVMRLVESMPKGMNMKCFMGSYFTSVDLLLELKKIGILATGAIRPDRLPGCMLKTEREMKKKGRGSIVAKVSEAGDITAVRWLDNSVSNVVSTHVGVGNTRKVKRRREATKSHVQIDCPEVIVQYNAYMVGVDKLDFLMSLEDEDSELEAYPGLWSEHRRSCSRSRSRERTWSGQPVVQPRPRSQSRPGNQQQQHPIQMEDSAKAAKGPLAQSKSQHNQVSWAQVASHTAKPNSPKKAPTPITQNPEYLKIVEENRALKSSLAELRAEFEAFRRSVAHNNTNAHTQAGTNRQVITATAHTPAETSSPTTTLDQVAQNVQRLFAEIHTLKRHVDDSIASVRAGLRKRTSVSPEAPTRGPKGMDATDSDSTIHG